MKRKTILYVAIILVIVIGLTILLILNTQQGRGDFKIIDNTEACDETLYQIYEDSDNIYYLSCIKEVFLEYANGYKIEIKKALSEKKVTIKELQSKGMSIIEATK